MADDSIPVRFSKGESPTYVRDLRELMPDLSDFMQAEGFTKQSTALLDLLRHGVDTYYRTGELFRERPLPQEERDELLSAVTGGATLLEQLGLIVRKTDLPISRNTVILILLKNALKDYQADRKAWAATHTKVTRKQGRRCAGREAVASTTLEKLQPPSKGSAKKRGSKAGKR